MSEADPAIDTHSEETAPAGGKPQLRKRLLTGLAIIVVAGIAVWAVYHFLLTAPAEETDDAYVAGDIVQITARDPGTITALHADNTQSVKRGDLLVELDPLATDVALEAAAADLASAVRATRASFSNVGTTDAAVAQAGRHAAVEQHQPDRSRSG